MSEVVVNLRIEDAGVLIHLTKQSHQANLLAGLPAFLRLI